MFMHNVPSEVAKTPIMTSLLLCCKLASHLNNGGRKVIAPVKNGLQVAKIFFMIIRTFSSLIWLVKHGTCLTKKLNAWFSHFYASMILLFIWLWSSANNESRVVLDFNGTYPVITNDNYNNCNNWYNNCYFIQPHPAKCQCEKNNGNDHDSCSNCPGKLKKGLITQLVSCNFEVTVVRISSKWWWWWWWWWWW